MKKLLLLLFSIILLSSIIAEPITLLPKSTALKLSLHRVNKHYIALIKISIPKEYIFKYLVISANATAFTKLFLVRNSSCLEKYVSASTWSLTPCLFYRMFPGNYTLVILSNSNNVYLKIKIFNYTHRWFQKALEDKAQLKFSQMPENIYRNGPIAILVESNIYSNISKAINRFADDIYLLTSTEVLVYSVNFSKSAEVREFLRQLYFTKNISGAIFVGNIPLPRMKLFNKTYFSLVYYEDLDGVFVLENNTICLWNNTNGLEIWVSLITPPKPVSKSRFLRIIFLNKYFEKNHLYKVGLIRVPHRCLIVVDRDWRCWIKDCYDEVTTLYRDKCYVIGGFSENYRISAKEYELHINIGYELATGWVHGGFTFSGGGNFDGLRHEGARKKGPGALVHIMSTCGFSNIDEDWCQALSFIFGDSITLATIGPTKSEGILEAYTLFNALSEGKTLGEAYLYWLNYRFTDDPWCGLSRFNINTSTHSWGLSVVLYGDPTLLLKGEPTYIELVKTEKKGNFIEVTVKLVDNSLQPVPFVPVYCAIKVGRVWRIVDYAVTNSSGEALLRSPASNKLAIFTRGAIVGERFYRPSLSYLDFNEKERNVSLSSVNYVEDLENKCLNVTVSTRGEPLSVVIFYKRENTPWRSVSMMKVDKNKYFIRIPAREKELIKFKIRIYITSNKYIESNTFIYRLSSENLLIKVKRSPLVTVIILFALTLAIILAVRLTTCSKAEAKN